MTEEPAPAEQTPASGVPLQDGPERQSFPFLVLQFFIFPMAIVAVCVTVFVVFGLIAAEGKGARDYLSEIRSGSANRRWQAAFELSKRLQAGKDPALADPKFAADVLTLFQDSGSDDPRVRRYLAVTLGRLGERRAVPVLLELLDAAGPQGDETLIYAIWALGAIGDPTAAPGLIRLAQNEDPGVRKAVAHALGAFAADTAREALHAALQDPVVDVRWNAALALARRGDAAAAPVLGEMLDRARLAKVKELSPEQQDEAVLQAVGAAPGLGDPVLRATLERLRAEDPSLKVREAARSALQAR